jgi:Flp pilus assembly pilin Flp
MISAMSKSARRFVADRSAAAAVEYGIVTLIAVAVLFAVNAIGGNITSIFGTIAAAFTN